MSMTVSVIIPALNEEALIAGTLESVEVALRALPPAVKAEVILVDNGSTDQTRQLVEGAGGFVQLINCPSKGAARARNLGARCARGNILVFLDADTTIPENSIELIVEKCSKHGFSAGITKLGPRDGGLRAWCWWHFWNCVRRLPLPRAKAMPAFMFCTRKTFELLGPFNENVAIGEEWPILAELYRSRRNEFVYLRSVTARTSSRRMELRPFGYTRLFVKYAWAIAHYRGRVHYPATIRHRQPPHQDRDEASPRSPAPCDSAIPEPPGRLRYGVAFCVGRLLAGVELNAVSRVRVNNHMYYAKRRLRFTDPFVRAGNLYLMQQRAHARVLLDREWRSWEAMVYRSVYQIEPTSVERGSLLIPAHPGVALAALLQSESAGEAENLAAIGLAVDALCRLHEVAILWPDGQTRPMSHGDATVENVIVDTAGLNAAWVDFDTIHEARIDPTWRHADDLRALAYSAAARLPAASFPALANTIVKNYSCTAALLALKAMVSCARRPPLSFHLAQARVSFRNTRLLDQALMHALPHGDHAELPHELPSSRPTAHMRDNVVSTGQASPGKRLVGD